MSMASAFYTIFRPGESSSVLSKKPKGDLLHEKHPISSKTFMERREDSIHVHFAVII